jgi:hypothetical protein
MKDKDIDYIVLQYLKRKGCAPDTEAALKTY